MIYIHWLGLLLYSIIVVATIITVLMDNRQPAKTMAWVLVLLFVPVGGIVLYFFFGQNTRKEKLISQRSLDLLTKSSMLEFAVQKNLRLPDDHQALIRLFTHQNWALPFKDNTVEMFTNGHDLFISLLHSIAHAGQSIHIDTYIFNDDPLGFLIADALIDKAKEGVEVRVVYDDVGCWNVKNSFFERMIAAGIRVCPFMPVHFPAFTGKVNYRNHRKIVVIDGRLAYIGGMNIAQRYVSGTPHMQWRDTHLLVRGGAVYALQRAFLVDWYFVSGILITDRRYYPELKAQPANNCIIQVVTSSPISLWPDIMHGYVRILHGAKRYVFMESPYFLPSEPVLFAMRTAALAGVDVRIMIPRKSDARLVQWASRSYVQETIEAGVKVYLYETGFNHSKLLVCDDTLCTCGSSNIDFRSFENNFEANAFIYDSDAAMRMKAIFLADMEQSILVDEHMLNIKIPFLQRLWESLVRLLSPLL